MNKILIKKSAKLSSDAVFCCGFLSMVLSGDTSNFVICRLYKHIRSFRLACFIPFYCPHKGKVKDSVKLAVRTPSVDIVAIRRFSVVPRVSSERALVAATNFITTFHQRDGYIGHKSRLKHTAIFPLMEDSSSDGIAFTHGHCKQPLFQFFSSQFSPDTVLKNSIDSFHCNYFPFIA